LLLAERWDNAQDLAGWWLSEKLDGVRAYWDGKSLISRLGNRFHAPEWFLEGLPEIPLDGELWIGRKAFQRTVGIVRRQDQTDLWKQVRYVAFDAPGVDGAFEARLAAIRAHVARHTAPYLAAHEQMICTGLDHLRAELARIEALGGEGLMLRQPESRYEVGRSVTLLKVKNFRDAEARVVEHLKGAGRHKGRLGALLVELANGTRFSVGTGFSDAEREAPPPVGSSITFRYQELSEGGVPRFPSFVRVRGDAVGATAPRTTPQAEAKAPARGAERKAASRAARRFELVEGSSSKFWEVAQDGCAVTVRFGRIGSNGQTQTKELASEELAQRHADGLIEQKVAKGYRECSDG
jgi:DNA ligase-1